LRGGRKEEGEFEIGREAGRKGMEVGEEGLTGKGIEMSQDGRGWAWTG